MEFFDVIGKRYSVRSYKPDPVEPEKLKRILEAGRLAPTACNLQPFKIIVAETKGRKEALKKIYPREWFSDAPYIIGVCTVSGDCWVRRDQKSYANVDAAIVMDHMILAATDLGVGTCWIGAFDPRAFMDAFELEENLEPVVLTPLGYPSDIKTDRGRKPFDDLVIYK